MNDRELLELAAKSIKNRSSSYVNTWWNPLEYSDDALRLAVDTGLLVDCDNYLEQVEVVFTDADADEFARVYEPYGIDKYEAVRRAIVRAAAEIGRKME